MVAGVLIAVAGLVAFCLVVSACVESAGKMASRKRLPPAPVASGREYSKPSTKKRRTRGVVAPAKVRAKGGYYRCAVCKSALETPNLFQIKGPGYWLEVMLCCECWKTAASSGYSVYVPGYVLNSMYEEIERERLTDTN